MKKLNLRNFKPMSKFEELYIGDNAMLCLDMICSAEAEHNKATEIICDVLWRNLDYLATLEDNSIEYLYARYSWAMEICEGDYFESKADFFEKLENKFSIKEEHLPKCILEALEGIDNIDKYKNICKIGKMIFNYNEGRIKFLEIDTLKLEEIQKLLNVDTQEEGLRSIGIEEDSTLETFTVDFGNNLEADIKICSGQSNCFIDPVLFHDGADVSILDCEGSLEHGDEFVFEDNNRDYTVIIFNPLHDLERDIIDVLGKYEADDIDIIFNEDDYTVYLMYHSRHDSFPVGNFELDYSNYDSEDVNILIKNLSHLADKYDLGLA